MRRGWIITIAVVGCLALLVTAVLLLGNNGVQATEWRAYAPEDQARPWRFIMGEERESV